RGRGAAVPDRARVASNRRDQRPQIDRRRVEEQEDVAGDRAGLRQPDAGDDCEACLETARVLRPSAQPLHVKTSPAADSDEDDLDGDTARRGGWGGGALGSSGGGRTPLRGGSGRPRPHTSAFETPPSRTPRRRSVAAAVERASRLLR